MLRQAYNDDLADHQIFFPDNTKAKRYLRPSLSEELLRSRCQFGTAVFDNFPDARGDILGAGNCYATDNDAACIFHCLRIAEFGLRGLALDLKQKRLLKFKHQELETKKWGDVIDVLRTAIDALNGKGAKPRIIKNQRKRTAVIKFYSDALDSCTYFNNNWRLDAFHVKRIRYNSPDALALMTRVEQFMQFLAGNHVKLPARLPD